jgi:hypothetical protein
MATNSEKSKTEGSSGFSDDAIRRFLLGRLSESDQPAFERQLLSDDRLDARVHLAELDLADDYAYGRLDRDERESVEERFLVSSDRRRKVEVSLALHDRFAAASVVKTKSTFITRLRTLFYFTRPSWRLAFGLAILLVLFGAVWLAIKEPRIAERITNKIIPRRSPSRRAQQEVNHPANSSSPEHQTTPAPMPVHDQTSSSSVSLALVPAAADSASMPSLTLPKGEQAMVRLQLAVTPNQQGTYRVELLTVDGQTVFSAESIKAPEEGSVQIEFEVPARLLKSGNYQIRLGRDNAGVNENVGRYYFRVLQVGGL